jgi:hypothetical protein
MSGFNPTALDREFFSGRPLEIQLSVHAGVRSDEKLFPRNPRLEFDAACVDLWPVRGFGRLSGVAQSLRAKRAGCLSDRALECIREAARVRKSQAP